MSNCKCGNILQYEDNSVLNVDNNVVGLYYCNKCNKLYDASILDCEDEYNELSSSEYKKYIKWFSDDYQANKRQQLIHFYEGLLTSLGYYEEDKEIYNENKFLTGGLNTYVRWLNDNTAEQYHKEYNLKYNRFGIVRANLEKLKGIEHWIIDEQNRINEIDNGKISSEESLKSLIKAGILDKEGNLTEPYKLENNSKESIDNK